MIPGSELWIPCQWSLASGFQSPGFQILQAKISRNSDFLTLEDDL